VLVAKARALKIRGFGASHFVVNATSLIGVAFRRAMESYLDVRLLSLKAECRGGGGGGSGVTCHLV